MFFLISKVLAFILSPFLWIMVALCFAVFTRNPAKRKWLVILVFIFGYLLGNTFLFEEVARKWEYPMTRSDAISKPYDVGIVLGGMAAYDTTYQRVVFHESSDRLWQALYLYRSGKIKKLLISGGSGSLLHKEDTEADRLYSYLVRLGIPPKDLLIESKSRNTRENAVNTAKLLNDSLPDAKCLLITSSIHMKRALGCFQKVHLDITPYSTNTMAGKRSYDPDKLLVPSAGNLDNWNFYLKEVVGFYTYKIKGYL